MMVDFEGTWWLGDFGATVKAGTVVEETTACEFVDCCFAAPCGQYKTSVCDWLLLTSLRVRSNGHHALRSQSAI